MSGSSAGASLEPVRRFEVFTGEGRRRKWALADKMALVAEMATTDNISELARRHGLRPSQLFTWRRELRYAAEATAPPPFVPAGDGVSVKIARGADAQVIAAVIEALKIAR